MQYLSNIELYYSSEEANDLFILNRDEFNHAIKVMRHSEGDEIYFTDGKGKIYLSAITQIKKDSLTVSAKKEYSYENVFSNITFCIPILKSSDRFEFALEKCTELGITKFIVFNSERAFKKSVKKERLEKIVLAAMKQSLRSYLPEIKIINSPTDITYLEGRKILFEQTVEKDFSLLQINKNEKFFFIFGPEGGFSDKEINLFNEKFKLAVNRLRTETAVIKCASIINRIIK